MRTVAGQPAELRPGGPSRNGRWDDHRHAAQRQALLAVPPRSPLGLMNAHRARHGW